MNKTARACFTAKGVYGMLEKNYRTLCAEEGRVSFGFCHVLLLLPRHRPLFVVTALHSPYLDRIDWLFECDCGRARVQME